MTTGHTAQIDVFAGITPSGRPKNTPESRTPTTQAERVVSKFGNARKLAVLLELDPSTVYKWNMPVARGGTDGRIPSDKLERIMAIARPHGVLLTDEDVSPKRLPRPWVRAPKE